MNTKAKKFIGPTKRMRDALEVSGLNIDWPTEITDGEELAIEASFYTGDGWQKSVLIDLRDREYKTKADVDIAVADQLDAAYEDFDVDEEAEIHIRSDIPGKPSVSRIVEDMHEQEEMLRKFYETARAVIR